MTHRHRATRRGFLKLCASLAALGLVGFATGDLGVMA